MKIEKDTRPVGIIKQFVRSQFGVFCIIKLNKQVNGESQVVARADFVSKT